MAGPEEPFSGVASLFNGDFYLGTRDFLRDRGDWRVLTKNIISYVPVYSDEVYWLDWQEQADGQMVLPFSPGAERPNIEGVGEV